MVVLVLVAVLRAVAVRRRLAARSGFVVLPTDSFAPTPVAVQGWGYQLAGTRRWVRGWWTRRARALRFRIGGAPEDSRMVTVLAADPDALRALRVTPFGEVELRPVGEVASLVEAAMPDRPERAVRGSAGAERAADEEARDDDGR